MAIGLGLAGLLAAAGAEAAKGVVMTSRDRRSGILGTLLLPVEVWVLFYIFGLFFKAPPRPPTFSNGHRPLHGSYAPYHTPTCAFAQHWVSVVLWAVTGTVQVCEWTGACGSIDGTNCSSKCIGSTDIISSYVSSKVQNAASSSLLYCHLLATTITNAYATAAKNPLPMSNATQVSNDTGSAAGTRLLQAPLEGCPSEEVITNVTSSPYFQTILQAGITKLGDDGASSEGLFGVLRAPPLPTPVRVDPWPRFPSR